MTIKKVYATRNVLITKAGLAQGHLHTLKKKLRKDTRIFFFFLDAFAN